MSIRERRETPADPPLRAAVQREQRVTILRADGSEAPGSPVIGQGLVVPWALAVDGNGHVWVSNF
jgi:hypothetical protein